MGYHVFLGEKCLAQNATSREVEEVISTFARFETDCFLVHAGLPINISAVVLRQDGRETVEFESCGVKVSVLRHTSRSQPDGELGVSCDPHGERVPVRTFNLELEGVESKNLDRGLVWVHPGEPTYFQMIIKAPAARTPELISQLLDGAYSLIETKITNKLADAVMATL